MRGMSYGGKNSLSWHTTPNARTREAALGPWRMRHFGGDFDPVRVAVDDAVCAFSDRQPQADRLIWLKVCNEIGFEAFLEQMADVRRARHVREEPSGP